MNTPENLLYTQSDEWLKKEDDGTITLGITDYAQHELGEIVYVELPEVGSTVAVGDSFGVVESVKAVGDLHTPVAGEVIAVNDAAPDSPAIVNESPYENGWLVKIKPDAEPDTSALLDAAAYTSYRG